MCVCACATCLACCVLHGILAFPSWKTFFYSSRSPWLHCRLKAVIWNENSFPLGSFYRNIMVQPHGFHWPLWGKRLCSNPAEFPRESYRSRRMGVGRWRPPQLQQHMSWVEPYRVGLSLSWAAAIAGATVLTRTPHKSVDKENIRNSLAWILRRKLPEALPIVEYPFPHWRQPGWPY